MGRSRLRYAFVASERFIPHFRASRACVCTWVCFAPWCVARNIPFYCYFLQTREGRAHGSIASKLLQLACVCCAVLCTYRYVRGGFVFAVSFLSCVLGEKNVRLWNSYAFRSAAHHSPLLLLAAAWWWWRDDELLKFPGHVARWWWCISSYSNARGGGLVDGLMPAFVVTFVAYTQVENTTLPPFAVLQRRVCVWQHELNFTIFDVWWWFGRGKIDFSSTAFCGLGFWFLVTVLTSLRVCNACHSRYLYLLVWFLSLSWVKCDLDNQANPWHTFESPPWWAHFLPVPLSSIANGVE